jgi:membrane protein YqaA with SNARE-associated domain
LWLIGFLGSPLGIFVLAGLDSTIFFSFPGAIDAVIVLVAARGHYAQSSLIVASAVAGSMAGAALTFWTGARIGEHGLDRFIEPKRLTIVRRRIRQAGSVGLAALDLVPPPFPFTPFILAAGALDVNTPRFFVTLAGCRVIRFGGEAVLASLYGRRLLLWAHSGFFSALALAACALAMALTVTSIAKAVASSRHRRRPAR